MQAPSSCDTRIGAGQAECRVSGLEVTGSGAAVAFLLWVQEVGSSNLPSPTNVMSRDIGKDPNPHQGSDFLFFLGP